VPREKFSHKRPLKRGSHSITQKSLGDLLAAFPEMDFVARTIEAHEISLNGLVTFKLATMGAE
jgi:hypothetical protein